jgi:hypothetical protein
MTENQRRNKEFVRSLQDELARSWRAGVTRVDRTRIEEIGRRVGLDPTETYETVEAVKGDVWEGEFVASDEEPGWEAMVLENVPSSGPPEGTGI